MIHLRLTLEHRDIILDYNLSGLTQIENIFFSKLGNFWCLDREIGKGLKSQGKVGEFENNWLWQSSENILILNKGKGCTFLSASPETAPPHQGLQLKERLCSMGEQILSFKSNPKFQSEKLCSKGEQILSFKSNPKFQSVSV